MAFVVAVRPELAVSMASKRAPPTRLCGVLYGESSSLSRRCRLAKAKIPLLLVYGDKDSVVPHTENSAIVYERYKTLEGPVEQIIKPGQDHHPHGLKDVTPVVDFFTKAWEANNKEATSAK